MIRCCNCLVVALLALSVEMTAICAEEWSQFRGPDGQGHTQATNLPTTWSETENVAWKTLIPGGGHSSPVLADGLVWLTSAIDTPATEEEIKKRLEVNTGGQPVHVAASVSLHAIGVDQITGKIVHDVEVLVKKSPQWVHALNTYASPTPVLEGGRLYCHFGAYGTGCIDTKSGQVLWQNQDLEVMHENGPGSSPVSWGDLIIFHCDGSDEQYIAALNKSDGTLAWKTDRSGEMNSNPQLKKAYGTPLVVEIDGRDQVVSPAADWLYSYDPATGKELWKVAYGELGFSIVPRPVAGHGMIFFSTSFMKAQILALRYADVGDKQPYIAWRYAKQAPQKPSPLLVGEQIYIVGDKGGIATCLEAKTGEPHWQERLGGNYSASPLSADGKIYFCSHEGVTTVVAPGTEFKRLAKNQLDGSLMASPAAINGALFLRTDKALYRLAE